MTSRLHSGRAALFALLASSVFVACEAKLTELTEAVGPIAFNFAVGPAAARLPSGTADREIVRTLRQWKRVWYAPGGGRVDTTIRLPSNNTQDTLATDSTMRVMVVGLRALDQSRVYQVWAQRPDGTISPVYGRVVEYSHYYTGQNDPVTGDSLFAPDSAGYGTGSVNTYPGSDAPTIDSVAFQLLRSDPLNTFNPFDPVAVNGLLVSIEAGPASAPSPIRFLWRRTGIATGGAVDNVTLKADTVVVSLNPPGPGDLIPDTIEITRRARSTQTGSGALLFGNYSGLSLISVQPPQDYAFGARGAGTGGARGPELSVDLRELARPPVGFYYVGYLVDRYGVGVLVDTLRSAWSRDSTVSRVSLYDADVNPLLPGILGGEIRAAQVRNCASGSGVNNCQNTMDVPADGTFLGYDMFQLKLEPKGGVAPSRNKSVSLAGPLPKQVK